MGGRGCVHHPQYSKTSIFKGNLDYEESKALIDSINRYKGIKVELVLNKKYKVQSVTLPKGKKVVGCKWIKTQSDRIFDKYKARYFVNGYTQK